MGELVRGRFKGWASAGTYGFIAPEDGGKDVFVGKTRQNSYDELRTGSVVIFDVKDTDRGRQAVDIKVEVEAAVSNVNEEAMSGVVKFFDENRGYGFITADCGVDVYVGRNEIGSIGLIGVGDIVQFRLNATPGSDRVFASELKRLGFSKTGNPYSDAIRPIERADWERLANIAESEPWDFGRRGAGARTFSTRSSD